MHPVLYSGLFQHNKQPLFKPVFRLRVHTHRYRTILLKENEKARDMTPDTADKIFEILSAENPSPQTELNYTSPYTLLVAVVLSAQSTDAGVNKATKALFQKVRTPEDMLALGEDGLTEHIKTIGLYKGKAKNVIALSKMLIEDFGGRIPDTRDDLQKLPGVGRKTANVILNIVYGQPTIAVDTHIFRVANRTGLASGKTPDAVEAGLENIIPERWREHAHHWLILHGRYICKARKPHCAVCPISALCAWPEKAEIQVGRAREVSRNT